MWWRTSAASSSTKDQTVWKDSIPSWVTVRNCPMVTVSKRRFLSRRIRGSSCSLWTVGGTLIGAISSLLVGTGAGDVLSIDGLAARAQMPRICKKLSVFVARVAYKVGKVNMESRSGFCMNNLNCFWVSNNTGQIWFEMANKLPNNCGPRLPW